MSRRAAALIALLTLAAVASAASEVGSDPGLKEPLADFLLVERDGRHVSLADLRGKVWVASFVMIDCPDARCPQVTQTVQRLQARFASQPDVAFVTFVLDAKDLKDADDTIRRYADAHEAHPRRWLFLRGDEAALDAVQESVFLKAKADKPGVTPHSQRVVVVDRAGNMRGTYVGLKRSGKDIDPNFAALDYDDDFARLVAQIDGLAGWHLPAVNAALNGLAGVLLVAGYVAIRRRYVAVHKALMLAAVVVSAVFLACYLYHHLVIKGGVATRFADTAAGAPGWVAGLYYLILLTHTVLAIPTAPVALWVSYLGLRDRLAAHVRVARVLFPVWVYVSVTGVVVYWMLYRMYP